MAVKIEYKKKDLIQTIIGIVIGGFFLYLTLKNKPLTEIFNSIKETNLFWSLLSAIFLFLTFVFRFLRWNILIKNINFHPPKGDVFYSLMLGYFFNSFTPKFGEVLRCTWLAKNNNIPLSKSFGTVVSERIYDILILLLGLTVIVLIEIKRFGDILAAAYSNIKTAIIANGLLSVAVLFVLLLAAVFTVRLMKKKNIGLKILDFLKTMYLSMIAGFKIKEYKMFLLYTALIWIVLVFMNYCFLKALPQTEGYSLYFAAVVLFAGSIGWALPSPGGIGTTHFFILKLFVLFNLDGQIGVLFGVLSNGLTFIFILFFGLMAIILRAVLTARKAKKNAVV